MDEKSTKAQFMNAYASNKLEPIKNLKAKSYRCISKIEISSLCPSATEGQHY